MFTVDNQVRCAGMLFSNHESTIEQYSYREHSEPGKVESERIYKVVELGIAHSPEDIQQFLEDFRT